MLELLTIACMISTRVFAFDSKVSSESELDSMQCGECFWVDSSKSIECVYLNCRSEILGKKALFSSTISPSELCLQCYNEDAAYFDCVIENCKKEISEKTTELVIKTPYVLRQKQPIKVDTCEECVYSYFDGGTFVDCYSYTCKEEAMNKEALMASLDQNLSSKCGFCAIYSDQEFYNCAYFYCKNEITKILNNLYSEKKQKLGSGSGCETYCYKSWYYLDQDYDECISTICKAHVNNENIFSFKPDTEMSNCDVCNFYFVGDVKVNCVKQNCKQEVLSKLSASATSTEIMQVADKYFEGKPCFVSVRPEISFSQCQLCDKLYSGDGLIDCMAWNCKSEMLDKKELVDPVDDTKFSRCTDHCYYSYYYGYITYTEYSNCYYYYCKDEVLATYQLQTAKDTTAFSKYTQSLYYYCDYCYYDYYEYDYDCYSCYKNAILDKSALFAAQPAKNSKCNTCFALDGVQYDSCVYLHCKEEALEQSKLVAVAMPNKLYSKPNIKTATCDQCVTYYYYDGSYMDYQCYYYSCKNEIVNKEKLFADEDKLSLSCKACKNYDGDEYLNCARWYCKNEIVAKFETLYAAELSDETMGQTDPCVDVCFYNWYYYGEDYDSCALYCSANVMALAKRFDISQASEEQSFALLVKKMSQPSEFISDNKDVALDKCGQCLHSASDSLLYDCVLSYCKSQVVDAFEAKSVVSTQVSLVTKCDTCYKLYSRGAYTYDQYYYCYYWYCKNEILNEAELYKQSLPTVSTFKDSKYYTSQSCTYYYYSPVYGYDYYYCYVYYYKNAIAGKTELLGSSEQESSYMNKAGFGASAVVLGAFVYFKYSKKRSESSNKESDSQTSYKIMPNNL